MYIVRYEFKTMSYFMTVKTVTVNNFIIVNYLRSVFVIVTTATVNSFKWLRVKLSLILDY